MDEKQNTKGLSVFVFDDKTAKYTQVDDYTIEFVLPEVNMSFVQNLADIKPIPKHIYEGQAYIAESPNNTKPIGNGSFKFKEQKSGELYQVERNSNYYGDVALLDGIVYRVIPDSNAVGIALENGEITASYIKANQVERYKKNEHLQLITFSEGMVNNIFFRVSNPKVNDTKVRQAISYAIDKEKSKKNNKCGLFSSELEPIPRIDRTKKLDTILMDIPSPIDIPKGCPFQTRCTDCMEICKNKKPDFVDIGNGHNVACFLTNQTTIEDDKYHTSL